MRYPQRTFLAACIIILLALIFLEPSLGERARNFLSPRLSGPQFGDDASLAAQNEQLKAQIAQLQNVAAQLPQNPKNYIRAMVFSRYPFNFKNEFLIDAGEAEGVAAGKGVMFQGILIGSVAKTFDHSALVSTAFESGFKVPVRIGSKGYDGLFIGGAYPKVASIEKNAAVAPGDIVYSAASSLPYGLPIGVVSATSTSADGLFQEASLSFAYDVNTIQTVLIAR